MNGIIVFFILSIPHNSDLELLGSYSSINNGFEWYSTLTLQKDNRFIYLYGLSGCQGKITGIWNLTDNKYLEFVYDDEFVFEKEPKTVELDSVESVEELEIYLESVNPCYPDLNSGEWTVTKRGLKLNKNMDCSCWPVKGLHKKIN